MSRFGGRGRGGPRRYHALPSRPSFPQAISPSQIDSSGVATSGQGNSLNFPRNVIPGLGLGLSSGSPAQQPYRAGIMASQPPRPDSDTNKTAVAVGVTASRNSASEEGEVSEVSDDDIYKNNTAVNEPQTGFAAKAHQGTIRLPTLGRGNNAISPTQASPAGQTNGSRQRSGSYSPHLSPREIDNAHSSTQQNKRDLLGPTPAALGLPVAPISGTARTIHADQNLVENPTDTGLLQARKKAKDAILQLVPLNIRFEDYLKEGIDGAILGNLFGELELNYVDDAVRRPQQKTQDITMTDAPAAPKAQEDNAGKAKLLPSGPTIGNSSKVTDNPLKVIDDPPKVIGNPPQVIDNPPKVIENPPKVTGNPDKVTDKSEERKDRIARLLAAKGSKAIGADSDPSRPTATSSTPTSAKTASSSQKAQSEKSKLIQQKMRELQKARESLTRSQSQQESPKVGNEGEKPSARDAAADEIASKESRDFLQRLSENGKPAGSGKPSPSSTPGLLISATRQPSQSSDSPSQPIRPTSSLADRSVKTVSRPFGQTPSRPLLIDVSDDDDDTEMDVDSPIRPLGDDPDSSTQRAAVSNVRSRQDHTPASAGTPSRSLAHGGENLASMNKKIEAMKRRIAEAEARKRIKLSAQASPATSPQYDGSRCVSVEAGSMPRDLAAPASSSEGNRSPPAINSPATVPRERPIRPAKSSRARRGRSVTASERLPFIEARRKEQLLKLKTLQSEMARIEQDIAQSMEEEEALKQDLAASDSGSDERQDDALAEAGLSVSAQPNGESSKSRDMSEELSDKNKGKATDVPVPETTEAAQGGSDASKLTDAAPTVVTTDEAHESSEEADVDVVMEDRDSGQDSDNYEPPEANGNGLEASPAEPTVETRATTQNCQSSAPEGVSTVAPTKAAERASDGGFVPYETPLQCFRAFRFHPEFGKHVGGGLRSLTYSNKIDVRKQVCPDELAGQPCPRGNECEYQHFESMRAPDDQILLQLGAAGHYQEAQRQEYIAGLRELLTDLRNRKVKDFNTISQGIIDYRARFLGDATKILPLGGVSL
ncbi:Protein red1 [Ophiocordyceps camponoti-floridani]|uniref:Protein red1 n=1 Tax=Ophiocordyceps camponoti-floridani TaxID=2030778 RepID=A0A8H4VGM2_9HYPO|nr:Protein red1 [Ophiocordyceps camponoti-floridani]